MKKALIGSPHGPGRYFAGAPTRDQAKRIFWPDLKAMTPKELLAGPPSEGELIIRLVNGSEIHVLGFDKPERAEGVPWDHGALDEYGNMKAKVWSENIRPALSDRQGTCDFTGVPEGRNHYYDLYRQAKAAGQEEGSEWAAFHWVSADILPASEIAAAKRDLDDLTFRQEYEASFVNFEGRAYYPFDEALHCGVLSYDRRRDLALCFDFNVSPGIAVIVQEQDLPSGQKGTGVIGEVHIPRNSNTVSVCRKIVSDWGGHAGLVECYGDATGGASGSAKVQGSDWDLIKRELSQVYGDRLRFRVPASNPRERSRLNAVNSRLKSGAGEVRLMVDAARAPNLVKDFEGVTLLKGGAGEIDKKRDPALTHMTDALGYYIEREFPVSGGAKIQSQEIFL